MSVRWRGYFFITTCWLGAIGGCSSTELSPGPALPAPPPYVQIPHPLGFDMTDLRGLFYQKGAPTLDSLQTCDVDFQKLHTATQNDLEILEGTRELVKYDPVHYHWCFYGKLMILENQLKSSNFIDEKQKAVLSTYSFLVPTARAFMEDFHDSRYLRWAIRQYRKSSEWLFFRKLELTPKETSELVEATNPFGLWKEPGEKTPVLQKYSLTPTTEGSQEAPGVAVVNPVPAAPHVVNNAPKPQEPEPEEKQPQADPERVPAGVD